MSAKDYTPIAASKNRDASYLEQWLEKQHGDIIKLHSKAMNVFGWDEKRTNAAFFYVFVNSNRVRW